MAARSARRRRAWEETQINIVAPDTVQVPPGLNADTFGPAPAGGNEQCELFRSPGIHLVETSPMEGGLRWSSGLPGLEFVEG